ncbi:MAG: O-antigen ligase family protein [Kiloniellales bacterium]
MVFLGIIFLWSLAIPVAVDIGTLNMPLYRFVLLIGLIPAFISILSSPDRKFQTADVLIFLSFIWVFISLLANHGFSTAIEPTGSYILEVFSAFLIGKAACRNKQQFLKLYSHVTFILCLLFPFVLIQSFTGQNIILDAFRSIFPILPPSIQDQRLGLFRANVSFPHSILFGIFASFAFCISILSYRKLKFLSIPVMSLSTFFSLSTGALLVIVVQFIFLIWKAALKRIKKKWWYLLYSFLFVYVFIDTFSNRTPFHVFVDYLTFNSGSAYNRILIWKFGTAEVADHPIFGIGFNEWNNPSWMSDSMDNFWLAITVRYGLPLFLLFFGAFLTIFIKACRREFPDDPQTSAIRLGWCLSLLAFAIGGTTVHFFGAVFPLFLFLWGSGAWFYEQRSMRRVRRASLNDTVEAIPHPTPGKAA